MRKRKSLEERFWAKVLKTPTCYLWTASTTGGGRHDSSPYGQIMVRLPDGSPTMRYAHRVAWELANGPIPAGLFVLHRCDVTTCVRVSHLFLGTHDDNMVDQWTKGRNYFQTNGNPSKKLTEREVGQIRRQRARGVRLRVIAEQFGVSEGHVSMIARELRR